MVIVLSSGITAIKGRRDLREAPGKGRCRLSEELDPGESFLAFSLTLSSLLSIPLPRPTGSLSTDLPNLLFLSS